MPCHERLAVLTNDIKTSETLKTAESLVAAPNHFVDVCATDRS